MSEAIDRVIDIEGMLDSAEREYIVNGAIEFLFPMRRKSGFSDFYQKLESKLREQDVVVAHDFRSVKEGYVKVSRPSVLKMTLSQLLRRRPHLQALAKEVQVWRREFTTLSANTAIQQAFRDTTADPQLTRSCFEVLSYLVSHEAEIRGLLPRQVRHSESTKLIGRESLLLRLFSIWRGESSSWNQFFRYFGLLSRPAEFRFFAPLCRREMMSLTELHGVFNGEWVKKYDFSANQGTLIVENAETFFSEAARSRDRLIIWGAGWKVVLLRDIQQYLPRPILYWGDLDKEGYEIYGRLKSYILDLSATLMDRQVVERNVGCSIRKEPFYGPYQSAADLQAEYQFVCQQGLSIEQEKIHDRPY